ncbi:MAG: hypothetical protein HKP41_03345 [Desulfobacterales bacterium]|nr:hypothetical protein [Deltaproteobacteria bacterium]NNK93365.1 hypothetical protein [Desulfobacterales bacterium]
MAAQNSLRLLDLITTTFLFFASIAGLYQALNFPDRSGMWPTFVMASLLLFVGLHLVNLLRGLIRHHEHKEVAKELTK